VNTISENEVYQAQFHKVDDEAGFMFLAFKKQITDHISHAVGF
jgi:hypothetical protein